jgi:hypothetical protein
MNLEEEASAELSNQNIVHLTIEVIHWVLKFIKGLLLALVNL